MKRGSHHNDETKIKIGNISRGKKHPNRKSVCQSEESKIKISKTLKGRKHSQEHNLKVSKALKGKKQSEETKLKLRLINIGKKQSKETIEKRVIQFRGEKHWNWKGNNIRENQRIRGSLECKLWRKAIFEKDNFTCQKYGIRGGNLVVHHINNFADFPELRLAIDNGITLSEKAHKEFHHKYGNKNNTKQQLEEFLKIILGRQDERIKVLERK